MIEKIKEDLLNSIGAKRYEHSLRVMNEANKLAEIYGVDKTKASIAGLLHDCGRLKEKSYLLKKAQDFGIILEDVYAKNDNLLHAYLGAKIAKKEYNIDDIDILNSIRYHTTGRANMSKLEKVIYMADYIEPGRDFDGIDEIRELCYKNLDKSLIKSIDNTIVYIVKRGLIIHEDTIKARNCLLFNLG